MFSATSASRKKIRWFWLRGKSADVPVGNHCTLVSTIGDKLVYIALSMSALDHTDIPVHVTLSTLRDCRRDKLVYIALWYISVSVITSCRPSPFLCRYTKHFMNVLASVSRIFWFESNWQTCQLARSLHLPHILISYRNKRSSISWPDMLIRNKLTDVSISKKSTFAAYSNRNNRSSDPLGYIVTDKPCSHPLDTLLLTSHVAILWIHCYGQKCSHLLATQIIRR